MLQLMAQTAGAQEQQMINVNEANFRNNANVTGNQSLNVRNITTSIPTGPNGIGANQFININVIDNGMGPNVGGPNVRGYTSSLIPKQTLTSESTNKPKTTRPVVVQKAKPKPKPVVTTSSVQRPKPKPKTTIAAPKRPVTRPAPVVAAPAAAVPVAMPQVQTQMVLSSPPVQISNPPLIVEQVMNNEAIVQTNNVSAVQTAVIGTANAPAVRSSAASGGSGSSGKSHRSGRKKHGSFYYNTNKKMMKLFAKTKSKKFDPAKCFVWK